MKRRDENPYQLKQLVRLDITRQLAGGKRKRKGPKTRKAYNIFHFLFTIKESEKQFKLGEIIFIKYFCCYMNILLMSIYNIINWIIIFRAI